MERNYRIALALCPGLEPTTYRRLVNGFGDAEAVWHAAKEEWLRHVRMHERTVQQLHAWRSHTVADCRHEQRLAGQGIRVSVQGDDEYPYMLNDLADPPLVLFTIGSSDAYAAIQNIGRACAPIAIVGTRRASGYGLEATRWISDVLSRAGCPIVSGMALGIDAAAHMSALEANGQTIAVLGTGVDICYPVSHQRLYRRIAQKGLLISEYAPGTPAAKYRFPERNRIIAGLSKGIVVVQAGEKSGAIRTADEGLELGRDIYVVPGMITSIHYRGSHKLLQQGAQILLDPVDVLRDYGIAAQATIASSVPDRWRALYDVVGSTSHPAAIARELGQPLAHIYAGLLELELSGLLTRQPDGSYLKTYFQPDVCK